MREQHTQRDRVIRKGRIAQWVAKILADIGIQCQLAIFNELHHAERCHQFGNGGHAVQRRLVRGFTVGGFFFVNEAMTKLILIDDFAIAHRQHRQTRQWVRCIVGDGEQLVIKFCM